MKKIFLFVAILAALAIPARAQAHTATLTWTNSVDTANTNVYRIAGSCPTTTSGMSKLTATPVTTATFTDNVPFIGVSCYAITAVANSVESTPVFLQTSITPSPVTGATITHN